MSTALNRLALRIHAVEHELKSSRIPQLAHSSVSLEDGTEMGVIEGFETAVAAEDIANGAVTAAVEAQEAADAAAAKALAVEAAAAQAKADAAAAATAATAAQSAADQAKADAAAVATEVDGIPAMISAAKSEAITTAAGTAQQKADSAKQAAIDAAAITAQAKADAAKAAALTEAAVTAQQKADAAAATAKAEAVAAAATDAQNKADLAKAAAINAAATDATNKANTAQTNAINSAATTAQQKADAAKQAAIDAAAADAASKASAAQSAATAAAATDAQTKADTAKAAAEAAAKTYSDTVSSGAKADAIAAAAADAKTKADAAEAAAKAAAAADAKAKADAAQAAAIAAAAADAQTKADVAKAAAINAAASDATTKANNAKQAAIDAAAITAQDKADLAKGAALADAKTYVQSRGTDLVANGTGSLGTNQNFPSFDVNKTDVPVGASASFYIRATGATSAVTDELIPVDPTKSYRFAFQARQTVAGAVSRAYGFIAPYAADGKSIQPYHYMYNAGTTTTLAQALNPGDTTIKLTSAANWWGQTGRLAGASNHWRSIIWWDYVDGLGKAWPLETYSQFWSGSDYWADGGVNLSTNTITLRAPYSGPARAAGTPLSNGSSGGSYIYMPSVANTLIPEAWTAYSDVLPAGVMPQGAPNSGRSSAVWSSGLPPATAAIKIGWLLNYAPTSGRHAIASVSFSDAAAAQAAADAVTVLTNGWKATGKTTIDGGKIEADSITAGQIATNAVTANELAANAVIAGKIAANAVVAGSIAAGQVSARHLVLADTSNMAEINETYAGSVIYSGWSHILETDAKGVVWSKRDNIAANGYFMFRNQVGPLPFKAGDRIRLTFEAFADATVSYPNPYYWTYGGPSVNGTFGAVNGSPTQITTTPQTFQYEVTVGAVTSQTQYLIGLAGATGRDIRVRNVRAYVMNAAELIVDGAVTANKVAANAVTADKIEAGAVIAGKLAADAIAANNIQAGAVIAGKLAVDAVLATNIKAEAVVAGKLAADAVLATNVAADAILARNIKAGQITADKLVAGTITAASGVIGSIDAAKITVGKLTAAQMATGTITAASGVIGDIDASKITVGKITAAQMQAGTITAASGIIGSIDAAKITVGQITASQLAADAIDGKVITGATVRTAASGQRWVLGTGAGASTLYAYTGRTDEQFPAYITAFADAGGLALSAAGISATPPPSGESTPAARLDIGVDPNDPTRRLVRQVWAHGNEVLADENILLQGAGTGTGRDGGHISIGRPRNNSLSYARGVHISGNITLDPNFGGAPGYGGDNKVTAKGDLAVEGNLTLGGKPAPLGWLGGDRRITNSGSTSGSTEVSICQTFINVKAGHKYRITGWSNLQSSVAGDGAGLRYKVNGSVVALAQVYLPIAGTAWPSTDTVIWTADITGQVPFETAFYRARGTGTLLCYANTSQASYIDVEHIGSA